MTALFDTLRAGSRFAKSSSRPASMIKTASSEMIAKRRGRKNWLVCYATSQRKATRTALEVRARSRRRRGKQSSMMSAQHGRQPQRRHHPTLSSRLCTLLDVSTAILSADVDSKVLASSPWIERLAWPRKHAQGAGWLMILPAFETKISIRWPACW